MTVIQTVDKHVHQLTCIRLAITELDNNITRTRLEFVHIF